MKLLFGLDLTDKRNKKMDGDTLVTHRLSETLDKEYNELTSLNEQFKKQSKLPAALRAVRWIAGMCVIAIPFTLIEGCSEGGRLTEAEIRATGIFLIFGVAMLLLFLFLLHKEAELARNQESSPEYLSAKSRTNDFYKSSETCLGVPQGATEMDVLAARYHWVDGKMYAVNSRIIWDYGNIGCHAWREADLLCLADITMRFDIPLSAFRGAEKRKNGYYISAWNKASSFRSPEYKQYKISIVNGAICVTGYLAIRLEYEGEDFELRIPPWETEPLKAITGWDI